MAKITVTLAQIPIALGDVAKNTKRMKAITAEAARRRSDIVIFPELWTTGYALERAHELADTLNTGVFTHISNAAREHKIAVLGSLLEKRGETIANCAPYIANDGSIKGVYRKVHLFRLMKEEKYLEPGASPLTLDLPWGKTGFAICYDLRFPELFRRYALEGTKVIFMPAEWPAERIEHWRVLLQARAIENQLYIVAVNTVGLIGDTKFGGHSMIVDPWGKIVVEASDEPAILTADLMLDRVDEVRGRIPVFEDRRPELYEVLDLPL